MSAGADRPFVSIKFSPVGRTYTFLLPDLALADEVASRPAVAPLRPGNQVVVQTVDGEAVSTVTRAVAAAVQRKLPTVDPARQVVRRASREDVVARLKHQQREQEAHRI